MRRRTAFGCITALALMLFVFAGSAMAQEPRRLAIGLNLDIPTSGIGLQGAAELPLRKLGAGELNAVVCVTLFHSPGGSTKSGVGGGLDWVFRVTDRTRVFAAVFAGVLWHLNTVGERVADFGATPGAGIRYDLTSKLELYALVTGAILQKAEGTAVGTQAILGITLPIGR